MSTAGYLTLINGGVAGRGEGWHVGQVRGGYVQMMKGMAV